VQSIEPFRIEEATKGAGESHVPIQKPPHSPKQQLSLSTGKLCGAFLVDQAFENHMRGTGGLRFDKCGPEEFRHFVNEEWEFGLKRKFEGNEAQSTFDIRLPAKAVRKLNRLKAHDSYELEM
jgi:hypothetical protein